MKKDKTAIKDVVEEAAVENFKILLRYPEFINFAPIVANLLHAVDDYKRRICCQLPLIGKYCVSKKSHLYWEFKVTKRGKKNGKRN